MSSKYGVPSTLILANKILRAMGQDDQKLLSEVIAKDLAAHGLTRWTWRTAYDNEPLRFQRLLRTAEALKKSREPSASALAKIFSLKLHRVGLQTGIQIPPFVFSAGLSIAHYGSIVVNSDARVGEMCRIHSATNIGALENGRAPRLGDRVYVGPGAVIYGDITVGSETVIGANSVVNSDVPPGTTVAGAPARIIAHKGSRTVMPQWFSEEGWRYE